MSNIVVKKIVIFVSFVKLFFFMVLNALLNIWIYIKHYINRKNQNDIGICTKIRVYCDNDFNLFMFLFIPVYYFKINESSTLNS